MKPESDDTEHDGEQEETEDLEWLAADGVNGQDSGPVSGKRAGSGKNNHANRVVPQLKIHVAATAVANSMEHNTLVETQTIKRKILFLCQS